MFDRQRGLGRIVALLGRLLARLHAFGRFLVELLGDRRGAAQPRHAFDDHGTHDGRLAQRNSVADLHFARGLDLLAIDLDPALADLFDGERPRLVEPRGPQPLVFPSALIVRQRQPHRGVQALDMPVGFAVIQADAAAQGTYDLMADGQAQA